MKKSNLTKKKVRVRGKGGKTYMRSMNVRSDDSPLTVKRYAMMHGAHLAKKALQMGTAAHVGGVLGAHVGARIGGAYGGGPIESYYTRRAGAETGYDLGGLAGAHIASRKLYANERSQRALRDVQRLSTGGKVAFVAANTLAIAASQMGAARLHHAVSVRFRRTH